MTELIQKAKYNILSAHKDQNKNKICLLTIVGSRILSTHSLENIENNSKLVNLYIVDFNLTLLCTD